MAVSGAVSRTPTRISAATLRLGLSLTLLLLLAGFVSIVWTPGPVLTGDIGVALRDPSAAHWFGTDHLGRDMASLLMKGVLTSFVVAAVATFIGAFVGIPLGLFAAFAGGVFDWLALRKAGLIAAFPALVIALLLAAAIGPGSVVAMVAAGIAAIPAFARAMRAGVLGQRNLDFVVSGRLAGLSGFDLARRHMLPAIGGLLLAVAAQQLVVAIFAEAALAYVGVGTQAPATSLGLLLREMQPFALTRPLLVILPGLALVLVITGLRLVADGLAGRLEPALRDMGGLDEPR